MIITNSSTDMDKNKNSNMNNKIKSIDYASIKFKNLFIAILSRI